MTNERTKLWSTVALATALTGLIGTACSMEAGEDDLDSAQQLSGAIFTTTKDGSVVNENVHYGSKRDVYLDGGPGPNAPNKAAALPAGNYYFQVTDPSGKVVLSQDNIHCRVIHINANGQIDQVFEEAGCDRSAHETGNDVNDGGFTVQLYPFANTPNNGNEYKAWLTPTGSYVAGGGKFGNGFVESESKTDNFKVKKERKIKVCKVNDKNGNGRQDYGEPYLPNWPITVLQNYEVIEETTTGRDGCVIIHDLPEGKITVKEGCLPGWKPTGPEVVHVDLTKCDFEKVIFTNKRKHYD